VKTLIVSGTYAQARARRTSSRCCGPQTALSRPPSSREACTGRCGWATETKCDEEGSGPPREEGSCELRESAWLEDMLAAGSPEATRAVDVVRVAEHCEVQNDAAACLVASVELLSPHKEEIPMSFGSSLRVGAASAAWVSLLLQVTSL